ncbi:MAG: NifB/NifX family molybdenum-iron cluster-binding protein [Christensenellaceae bacterium]
MKIAVTYENGQVFQHFGHTEQFKIYEINANTIIGSEIVSTNGSGHGTLAQFLQDHSIETLICGGIGGGAQSALSEAGIKLFGGVCGNADDAVKALIGNNLKFNPDVTCDHHDSEHGDALHTCGDNDCGSGNCGSH